MKPMSHDMAEKKGGRPSLAARLYVGFVWAIAVLTAALTTVAVFGLIAMVLWELL